MNKSFIIIIAIVVIGGGYLLLSGGSSAPGADFTSNSPSSAALTASPLENSGESVVRDDVAVKQYIVTYTDSSGYQPSTLRVPIGSFVTFKNESLRAMWTASDIHPSHRLYAGTSLSEHCSDLNNDAFDACSGIQPGESWMFIFDRAGEWVYHNHLYPSDSGTIIVTE